VLLVDDDPLVLGSLTQILRMDGHEVTTAPGGQAGIDEFARAQAQGAPAYDLVMTDLGMPHVDGRQVAQAVKRLSPGTGVVLLTGWGQSLLDDSGLPQHVDQIMAKPARLEQVRQVLAGQALTP
jgi:DNA-binding response OmpR family regulator